MLSFSFDNMKSYSHAVDTGTVHLMSDSPLVLHLVVLQPAGIIV